MTRQRTTVGKRNVQQQKLEKAQAKRQRREARRAAGPDPDVKPIAKTESELIEALAALQEDIESGRVSLQQFEERREEIRNQLQQLGEGTGDG